MPRPKSKPELLDLAEGNFNKLFALIDSKSVEEQEAEFKTPTMNRNIRDVLGHLHQWHLMLLDWYTIGMTGEKPEMPAPGYTWKTTSELNRKIWQQYSGTPLAEMKKKLEGSHKKVMSLINKHTDEELFQKKRYKWTGSTSLGAYLISSTSSHYDWAYKLIKKGLS